MSGFNQMTADRPHRCQLAPCRAALTDALGAALAEEILVAAGIAELPGRLPAGPRDLEALTAELRPFVALYRELLRRCDSTMALRVVRRAIIDSGMVSHGAAQDTQAARP